MKLTELEGAALGLVWSQGSTTAYELRKMIGDSPTPQWSASAGTVYPLVAKLGRARLVSFSSTNDQRGTRRLRITPAGKRAFKQWMLDRSPVVVGLPPDPIRTRVRFLGLLSSAEGSTLLATFERQMRGQLVRMRRTPRPAGAPVSDTLAMMGARFAQEKRVEWIAEARKLAERSRRLPATRREPRR